MRKSHHSLHGLLRRSLLRSVVCMILPVCVLAGLLVVLTQRYGADIALTTRASEVRTVLVQDLPDEVWNVVSGRISFEDGRQRMLIDSALWELNDMLDSAGEDEAQYLNAALRAIRDGILHDFSECDPTGTEIHILQADCVADAEWVRDEIRKAYPQVGEITITALGVVIGAHCGPGLLTVFYFCNGRKP